MKWHLKLIGKINKAKSKKKTEAIFRLWEGIGEKKLSENDKFYIKQYIFSIYAELGFNQKQAAMEVLLKICVADEIRELVFDYLGMIYIRYIKLAERMSNYLYLINELDRTIGVTSEENKEIGRWELDKTLEATRRKMKDGGSIYL